MLSDKSNRKTTKQRFYEHLKALPKTYNWLLSSHNTKHLSIKRYKKEIALDGQSLL